MSIKLGDLDLSGMRLGEKEVLAAYLGEIEVYTPGPFEGIKVTKRIETTIKGGTFTIKGQSSEPWSATTSEWITLSQTSGDAGKFEIEVTIAETDDSREASIDFTTENYSASCAVEQINYQPLNYIYKNGFGWKISDNINTLIPHTSADCEVRIAYKTPDSRTQSDRYCGYLPGDEGCGGDSNDFRIFFFNGGSFDYSSSRQSSLGINVNETEYDLTFGDSFVYDNTNERYIYQGSKTGQVPSPNCNIVVDVSDIKVHSVQIKQGGQIVFDGVAAKIGEQIGLWDLVSNKLVTNPNIDFSFE